MEKERVMTIEVSIDDIKKKLENLLRPSKDKNYGLITDVIIENLHKTEMGISHLYFALQGQKPQSNFLVGDEVLVHYERLYYWNFNKEAMIKQKLIVGDNIKAIVTKVDLYRKSSITLKYSYIKDDKKGEEPEILEREDDVDPKHLRRTEDCKIERPDNVGDLI